MIRNVKSQGKNGIKINGQSIALSLFVMALCSGVISLIDFDIDILSKVIVYILSFLAGNKLNVGIRMIKRRVFKSAAFILTSFLLIFWYTIAFVGNRCFFYPLETYPEMKDIFLFIICFTWVLAIVIGMIPYVAEIYKIAITERKINNILFWTINIFFILVPCLFSLYAYNPAISTSDSTGCLAMAAHEIKGMPSWNPVLYILFLRSIVLINDTTYSVVGVQILFWFYLCISFIRCIRNSINDYVILLFSFVIGFSCSNVLHVLTIWKDVPYSLSILWLTIVSFRLIINKGEKKSDYIEIIPAIVGSSLFRLNGIIIPFVFVPIIIFFIRNKKILISMIFSIFLIYLISVPVTKLISPTKTYEGGHFIGLSQDILGVYYSGGEVDDKALELIEKLSEVDGFYYDPYWARGAREIPYSFVEFTKIYLKTFFKNPRLMINAMFCRNDYLYAIIDGENCYVNCVARTSAEDNGIWTQYYPIRVPNRLTLVMDSIASFSAENKFLRIITWRPGFALAIMVFIFYLILLVKDRTTDIYIISAPLLLHTVGVALASGWSEYRYMWVANLVVPYFCLMAVYLHRREH